MRHRCSYSYSYLYGWLLLVAALLSASCGSGSTPVSTVQPELLGILPLSGGTAGGTRIAVRGEHLLNDSAGPLELTVGGVPATQLRVEDDTTLSCITPPGAPGRADVVFRNAHGLCTFPEGFTYHPAPTITSITPDRGTRSGGLIATITGSGFKDNDPGETLAFLGNKALTEVTIIDDGTLTGTTPPSWLEVPKDVRIRNDNGEAVLAAGFTYTGPIPPIYAVEPRSGPAGGGTDVTIRGDWYTIAGGELSVLFGSRAAGAVTRVSDQFITCTAPPNEPGWVSVLVENSNGATTLVGGFFYHPRPTVSLITPDSGYFTDEQRVTVTGTGYAHFQAGENHVQFGTQAARDVVVVDDATITCLVPPYSDLLRVDVHVTNTNGTGVLERAFRYVAPCWWETDFGQVQDNYNINGIQKPEIGFPFDFYGTSWTRAHLVGNGNVEFTIGSSFDARILRQWGQVLAMASWLDPCCGRGIYVRHMDDRLIITWDDVPGDAGEGITGSGSAQVHLRRNGQICILWKEVSLSWVRVAINPGVSHVQVPVDFSEGVSGAGPTDALLETWVGGSFDLENGFLMLDRNDLGGYDATFFGFLP